MALFVLLLYLLVMIPLLFTLLAWIFTNDPMRCWKLPKEEMLELFWIALAFAVALPFTVCGVLFTLFAGIQFLFVLLNAEAYDAERINGAIFMLFMMVFSVPSAIVGSIISFRKWQVVRQFFGYARPDFVQHENK